MQIEIETEALRKERDKASRERFGPSSKTNSAICARGHAVAAVQAEKAASHRNP